MIGQVLSIVFNPTVLLCIFLGVGGGICIGALPGLTSTMGVALLLPLTFGMDAQNGILLLLGIYIGAVYGGSISAILLHTPGTPASAATVIDGYEFSKRGEGGRALGISTLSSFIGGVVSCLMLMLISPQLAKLALRFSDAEYALLAIFGLSIILSVSGKSLMCWFHSLDGWCGQDNRKPSFHIRFGQYDWWNQLCPCYDWPLCNEPVL